MEYYCHSCGALEGHLQPLIPTASYTGSYTQLKKFTKHTAPTTTCAGLNSVFNSPDYATYADYVVNTHASGCIEIDDQGRINIIWCAGKETGFTLSGGVPQGPTDGVKLVLHTYDNAVHAFPTSSSALVTRTCVRCGNLVLS
jgi:hypothetical protein